MEDNALEPIPYAFLVSPDYSASWGKLRYTCAVLSIEYPALFIPPLNDSPKSLGHEHETRLSDLPFHTADIPRRFGGRLAGLP